MSAQSGQRVRGISWSQTTDEPNRDEPNLRIFVVQRDKERAQRVRLAQVRVRGRARPAKRREHRFTHPRVEVRDGDGEKPRHDELLRAGGPAVGGGARVRRSERSVRPVRRVVVLRRDSSDPVVPIPGLLLRQPVGPNFEQPAAGERRLAPRRRVVVVEILHHVPSHETEQHGRAKGKRSQRSQRQLHASPVRLSPRRVDRLILRSAHRDAEDLLHRRRQGGPGLGLRRRLRLADQTLHSGGRTRRRPVEPASGRARVEPTPGRRGPATGCVSPKGAPLFPCGPLFPTRVTPPLGASPARTPAWRADPAGDPPAPGSTQTLNPGRRRSPASSESHSSTRYRRLLGSRRAATRRAETRRGRPRRRRRRPS